MNITIPRPLVALAALALIPPTGAALAQAADGQKFTIETKQYSVLVMRDPGGALWPAWFHGRGADGGVFVPDKENPQVSFTVVMDGMSLDSGDQSKRVIGELVGEKGGPAVSLKVTGMKPLEAGEPEAGKKGKKGGPVQRAPFSGELAIGAVTTPVTGQVTVSFGSDKKSGAMAKATLQLSFTLTGAQIGMKQHPAQEIKVSATVYAKPAG